MRNFISIIENVSYSQNITPEQLIKWLRANHHTPEDLDDGDLYERIWAFQIYKLEDIALSQIDYNRWYIHDDFVKDYMNALSDSEAPPIIYDPVNKSIIDGSHRAAAAHAKGRTNILAYVGDASTYVAPDDDSD